MDTWAKRLLPSRGIFSACGRDPYGDQGLEGARDLVMLTGTSPAPSGKRLILHGQRP